MPVRFSTVLIIRNPNRRVHPSLSPVGHKWCEALVV